MSGHVAEAGRRAENNAVIVRQLLRGGDRRLLVLLASGLGEGFRRHGFRHAFDSHVHVIDPIRPFGHRLRQAFDVAVH